MTIQDIIAKIERDKKSLGIKLNPALSISAIEEHEALLNIILPNDIKLFYQFCNGFEFGEDLFRIIALNEVLKYHDELGNNEFYIAEYLIYSDHWLVIVTHETNSYIIIEDSSKTTLTNSFPEFLDRILSSNEVYKSTSLYDWRDEINNK